MPSPVKKKFPPPEPQFEKPNGPPKDVEVFFDLRDGSYWYKVNGRFVCMKKADVRMHMRAKGLTKFWYFDGQTQEDWPLFNAQVNRRVIYAGSLAGHRAGLFTPAGDDHILVTDEAAGVFADLPKKSEEPKWFIEFIRELLPDDENGAEQWLHFCYWLAFALRSLRKGDFRPGQVAVLAGPAQCGKSLLQYIITQIFGGRAASPWAYMNDESKFNYELARAEHWPIEDPNSTTDMRTRVQVGNKLKEAAFNENFSIYQKGKDPVYIPIWRRITLSINDEPEFLAACPPMDRSMKDKINLYHCSPAIQSLKRFCEETPALPGMEAPEADFDRIKVKAVIRDEVPLIRAWLLRAFKSAPKGQHDRRTGIVSYHNPPLLEELSQMGAEARLLSVIDQVLFNDGDEPWTGKAIQLEQTLRKSEFGFEVEKALRHIGQTGSYLGKLLKSHPHRISKTLKQGYAHWIITSPSIKKNEKETNGVQKPVSTK